MSRPEVLFPLFADLETLPGIGPKLAKMLDGAGLVTPKDLVFHLPYSGTDRQVRETLQGLTPPVTATVMVEVGAHAAPRQRGRPYRIEARDAALDFHIVYFHAAPDYLMRLLPPGAKRLVSGKVEAYDGHFQMVHPDHVIVPGADVDLPAFEPVYTLTQGITLKTMTKAVQGAVDRVPDLGEWIDPPLKTERGWPDWAQALRAAHAPTGPEALSATDPARERLAYDELFAHQLTLALARARDRKRKGVASVATGRLQSKVLAALPYRPTGAQARAMEEIAADMAVPQRMSRLLQGDVGAGKTLVAFAALLVAVEAGGQGAFMAPTEILARQHLAALRPLAETAGVVVDILTGRDKGAERAAKLAALGRGDIQILIGTHALFQAGVDFADLRLAVIDEQHRFGVAERLALSSKGRAVDTLVMTATPIPRSLELATYGDLDLSVLDEKPAGRKPITTALVSSGRMDEVVGQLQKAVGEGRQAYWVCPLVEESEVSDLTAATDRFQRLRAALGEGVVGLVHGQMPPAEKDAAMAAFQAGETKVLVATTVIEVGVDVPGASIMVIERAERFGLAQLHQLRGRVGRGSDASTCLMLYQGPLGETARRRLEILRETEDGFRIAEEDLAIRGAGDVIGTVQSGLPRFRVADLERQTGLMQVAQKDARLLLEGDETLTTPRGAAARVLLWLMEQDKAIGLITAG
ncbi:MAG: ATP-dependent DNA helicase RecG [Pseudomonadota bacterium]